MSFGQRVKLRRRQLGLTQKELAKLIGISRSAVNSWEIGDHTPGGDSAVKLPVYLQCSWDWLVTGKGDVSDKTPNVTKELLVPLIDKSFIVSFIEGTYSPEEYAGDNSAKMRDIFGASKDTFAFIEVSDGMEPRICSGDTVYVDPSQKECEPSGVYLFNVGGSNPILELGVIQKTPRGVMLHFDNQAPGWEPIRVDTSQCVGKVVAFIPSWIK